MSKNIPAQNCDFFTIRHGNDGTPIPVCFHPERKQTLCDSLGLACELATFDLLYGKPAPKIPCIECDHFCQSQVYDARCAGTLCAEHSITRLCPLKERCKAKVLTRSDRYGWCKLHNRATVWFESCSDHRKEGEKLV